MKAFYTILLLIVSNIFMTFACFIYTDEEGKLQTFLTKGMEKYMK